MTNRDPKTSLAVQWISAAATGVLVGLIPLLDINPPARLLAIALVLAGVPFGLRRPKAPWLFALVVAWPTAALRLEHSGWHAIFLLVYAAIGVYAGDWAAQWWQETHPPLPRVGSINADGTVNTGPLAADGSAVAPDGLPPQIRDRY